MDSNNKLFKYNFIQKFSTGDIDSIKKSNYKAFHEQKHGKQNLKNDNFSKIEENNVNYHKDVSDREATNVVTKRSIIAIDSRMRDYLSFPRASDFIAPFGKAFKDIKSIRLVSSEIPNSAPVIRNSPPELQNNIFYWQNMEDAGSNYRVDIQIQTLIPDTVYLNIPSHNINKTTTQLTIYNSKLDSDLSITGFIDGTYTGHILDENTIKILYKGGIPDVGTASVDLGYPLYSVEFKSGNYTSTTLTDEIEYSINFVKRLNNTGQYHYFVVDANIDTDIITFDSVITNQLTSNPISTTAASEIITVNSVEHGFKTGDRVKMIDVQTVGGITGTVLSGDFTVTVVDFNTFTYEVNTRANESTTGGGNTVKTGRDAPFRFLLDTENTLVQYKTGFPDEDSSEHIGSTDSFTTYTLTPSNLQIIGDYLRVTTSTPHNLEQTTILTITNISTDDPCEITVSTPHRFTKSEAITIRNSNSVPGVDGDYFITPTGVYTFLIQRSVTFVGNSGQVLFGGDKVALNGILTTPRIDHVPFFYVENTTSNTFDVKAFIDYYNPETLQTMVIRTSQVYVNHPNHGFNNLTIVDSFDSQFASIRATVPFDYIGSYDAGVSVIDGPLGTNTLDILLTNHRLITSDEITIQNSTTVPSIDGVYKVQFVTSDILRINFTHITFTPGTAEIFTGDKVNVSNSNSLPKVDGYWYIVNQYSVTSISTGTTESTITLPSPVAWNIGDSITFIGTDSVSSIDGDYLIKNIISPTQFTIDLTSPIVVGGTMGKVINKQSALVYTDFQIVTPGTLGVLGRSQKVLYYRVEADTQNGDVLGGIPLVEYNGKPREITRIIDINNYMLRFNNVFADRTMSGGGSSIRVSSELHGFRSIQANTDTGTVTGNLFRTISLEGENYVYLQIPGLDTVSTGNSSITNVFAKIILDESPGNMCFNSFISAPKEFDPPLDRLDKLRLKIIDYLGYEYQFVDLDYSLSLEVVELVERLDNTNMVSNSSKKLVLAGAESRKIRVDPND